MTERNRFEETVEYRGLPQNAVKANPGYAANYQGKLPSHLLKFWVDYGWGSWARGRFWLCDPAPFQPLLEQIFTGDPEYDPALMAVYGYNAFGQVFIWHQEFQEMDYDPLLNMVTNSEIYIIPETGKPMDDNTSIGLSVGGQSYEAGYKATWVDDNGKNMLPRAIKRLGELKTGEIYGFVPAFALGGPNDYKNLQKLPVVEHLNFLASLQQPTLYKHVRDEGFGQLVPVREIGPQNPPEE